MTLSDQFKDRITNRIKHNLGILAFFRSRIATNVEKDVVNDIAFFDEFTMCDWVKVKIVLKREGYHLKQFFPIKVSALKGLMKFRSTFFFLFLRLCID